jgi:hypothetical protein
VQNIHWDLLPGAIFQVLINLAIITFVLTIFGACILKYFVRTVPLLSLAILFFWAVFRVLFVVAVAMFVAILLRLEFPLGFSGLFSIAGMCVVGWLITRDLAKRYGVPSKFPGPGFKTMLGLLALSWVFVGAYFLLAG